ncbi:MAG: hypothetical protein ACE5G1_03060 [bacterium]
MSSSKKINRRELIKLGFGAAAGLVGGKLLANERKDSNCQLTPKETAGPFYPTKDQLDKDVDLTIVQGAGGRAEGDIIYVSGQVLDQDCQPVDGALVEIWQANKWGRYHHEADPNPARFDPNFQGWGQVITDENGDYSFKTIFPGAYPVSSEWTRTPHIHFKVSRRGYHELTTQMYFEGQDLNKTDRLILAMPDGEAERLIVKLDDASAEAEPDARQCRFDMVLKQVV